jgi:hypothetical protein
MGALRQKLRFCHHGSHWQSAARTAGLTRVRSLSEIPMSRFGLRFCVFAALCALSMGPAAARHHHHKVAPHKAAAVPPGFDGTYGIQITTTGGHGSCPASYAGTLTIHDFRVVALSDPAATATGGIEDDGTVSLAFRKDGQFANVGGQMSGNGGKGFWSSPTAYCGGLWHAERQN